MYSSCPIEPLIIEMWSAGLLHKNQRKMYIVYQNVYVSKHDMHKCKIVGEYHIHLYSLYMKNGTSVILQQLLKAML